MRSNQEMNRINWCSLSVPICLIAIYSAENLVVCDINLKRLIVLGLSCLFGIQTDFPIWSKSAEDGRKISGCDLLLPR